MGTRAGLALTWVAAVVAAMVPVLLALYLARTEGLKTETRRAESYAREVMRRTETIGDEIDAGIRALVAAHDPEPCSNENIARMRTIDLAASHFQGFGRVEDDVLVCSSLASGTPTGRTFSLGPPDVRHANGVSVRAHVELPSSNGTRVIVVERDGYAALVYAEVPVESASAEAEHAALAVLSGSARRVVASRGAIKSEWLTKLRGKREATFVDAKHVVALVSSRRYQVAAIAAVPIAGLERQVSSYASVLLPVGMFAGLVFSFALFRLARQQTAMPAAIRSALRHDELFLEYQPVVDLRTRACIGAEALVRWRRSTGELVRPDLFIPIAEESGLIERLTERVVTLVARDTPALLKRRPAFHVGVNLASADLHSEATIARIRQLVGDTGANPGNIVVEATERGFTDPSRAAPIVSELRRGGIRVAIDDFGTGYSSLSFLERFELDYLKIDKSFVDTVGTDAATSRVVLHIIEMAKTLGLEMVAEGVETEAQAEFLRDRGVQFAQGWLFGKPMAIEEMLALIESEDRGATT